MKPVGILLALGFVGSVGAQLNEVIPIDKQQVMAFWAMPNRLTVSNPSDTMEKGVWQVRLTTTGSLWLWTYNKGKKTWLIPASEQAPQTDEQKSWDAWIQAKLERDRWEALQIAQKSNMALVGKLVPVADKTFAMTEPPLPGPIPPGLLSAVGNPPKFAEVVVPMCYDIQFDDMTLHYTDNVKLGSPKSAYYRFANGTRSEGKSVKSFDPDQINKLFKLAGCSDSEMKIMRAVSSLEGGFDAVNTYDTGFVSIGFIQFASLKDGAGSLGSMLQEYKSINPTAFHDDFQKFGIDVNYFGSLDVVDPTTGAELIGADANLKIIDDKRLIAVFQRAGIVSENFQAAQIRSAKKLYYPIDEAVNFDLAGTPATIRIGDIIKSEAGIATLMDRKVNTGKLDPISEVLARIAVAHAVSEPQELAKFEQEIVAAMKYRKDYLSDQNLTQPTPPPVGKRLASGASRGGLRRKRSSKSKSTKSLRTSQLRSHQGL